MGGSGTEYEELEWNRTQWEGEWVIMGGNYSRKECGREWKWKGVCWSLSGVCVNCVGITG